MSISNENLFSTKKTFSFNQFATLNPNGSNFADHSKGQNLFYYREKLLLYSSLLFHTIYSGYNDEEVVMKKYDADKKVRKNSYLLFFNPFHCVIFGGCCYFSLQTLFYDYFFRLLILALLIHEIATSFFLFVFLHFYLFLSFCHNNKIKLILIVLPSTQQCIRRIQL